MKVPRRERRKWAREKESRERSGFSRYVIYSKDNRLDHYDLYLKVKEGWYEKSLNENISIEYIRQNSDKICWEVIIDNLHISLTDDFVEEFFDELPILKLFQEGRLSSKTIDTFKTYIEYLVEERKKRVYKSHTFFEAGYIYAPYVPMVVQTEVIERNFIPREGIMSRYSISQINNNLYGNIVINGN